jgi:hypothetical protein
VGNVVGRPGQLDQELFRSAADRLLASLTAAEPSDALENVAAALLRMAYRPSGEVLRAHAELLAGQSVLRPRERAAVIDAVMQALRQEALLEATRRRLAAHEVLTFTASVDLDSLSAAVTTIAEQEQMRQGGRSGRQGLGSAPFRNEPSKH